MDRVRRALDLARIERAHSSEIITAEPSVPQPVLQPAGAIEVGPEDAELSAAPGANAASGGMESARTPVFIPSADILERNRIFSPGSTEPAAIAYRMLRTQVLQRMDAKGWRTLAIFSPGPGDGKTTTAANLAVSLASDHLHTVLLVEFDFRHPTLAARFGLSPELGSDDAMGHQARVENCLYHPEGFDRLIIMPARTTLNNSSEVLAGPRGRDIVTELRTRYPDRIVLFDLPPVLAADDALSFAPLVECGLVVAAEGRTRRADLVRTIELLHKTSLVGTVLNRAAEAPSGY